MEKQEEKQFIKDMDTKLNKVILSFFNEGKEFWTILASQLRRTPTKGIKTITTVYTDKGVLLAYDPQYVKEASTSVLKYHIIHECTHIIYRHAYRFSEYLEYVDPTSLRSDVKRTKTPKVIVRASDIAMDIVANDVAKEVVGCDCIREAKGLTADKLPDLNINPGYGSSIADKYTSENINEKVIATYTNVVLAGGSCSVGGNKGGEDNDKDGNGAGSGESDKKDNNENGENENETSKAKKPKSVKGCSVNDHDMFDDTKNELDRQISKKFVEGMISEASRQCKDKGYLPGCVKEELESIKAPPKKDWKALLANYVAASIPAQSTRTWARINRKFPYVLKGKKPVRVPLIGLVQDTSGSVSDAAIKAFYREIDGIRKIHKADMELVQCDAEISDTKIISYKEQLRWSVSGRGGTEFLPALEYFDKAKRKPDVVVFFTDLCVGDDDVPSEPRNYKIIWVSVDKQQCDHFASLGKYGTFIHLDVDEDDD